MPQMLLFPDPRPLVERLGKDFFQQLPASPGVYLMRDASDIVLYVGKAKNLRKRLACYRVANPERMPRRHLRLLRAVARIEMEQLPNEASALARESELLRSLRPRFNRAGTWPGPPRFLSWRLTLAGLELAVTSEIAAGWSCCGPMGSGAFSVRAALARLLWCALRPERGLARMPAGQFAARYAEPVTIPLIDSSSHEPSQSSSSCSFSSSLFHSRRRGGESSSTAHEQVRKHDGALPEVELFERACTLLSGLVTGHAEPLIEWLRTRTATQTLPFELAVKEADLETIAEFAKRRAFPVLPQHNQPNPG
jgi:hypothetical protein